MNLVKWFRKNNKKVMAIVVVIIMVGFVGGSWLRQIGKRRMGLNETIAYFGEDSKITIKDRNQAQMELEILRAVGADKILRSIVLPGSRTTDLRSLFLADLLFPDRKTSAASNKYVKQLIANNNYSISQKQLNDIYTPNLPQDIYWLLLKDEAERAGLRVPAEQAGRQLAQTTPQIFEGASYSQLLGMLMEQQRISEERVLDTFAKLMSIIDYSRTICSDEDVTISQIRHAVSLGETIDAELMIIASENFTDDQKEPTAQQIAAHFEKYKKYFPGHVTDENPFGFGYKLFDRLQLEYITVKLDDVSKTIPQITAEETEDFYQRNRQLFTGSVPSDPNDPNSVPMEWTKSFAEVSEAIKIQMLRDKINRKAERILREARSITEADLIGIDESAGISDEEYGRMVGDYGSVAEELTARHGVNVYSGKTGLLNGLDVQSAPYLGRFYAVGYGGNPVRLGKIVFAVDQLAATTLGVFDIPKPRMRENIGPLSDATEEMMAIVRVINTQKAVEPKNIDHLINKELLKLEDSPDQSHISSIKDTVIKDLKKLSAMDTTKTKANELTKMIAKKGWEDAITEFNRRYITKKQTDSGQPLELQLQEFTNLQRRSTKNLAVLSTQSENNPAAYFIVEGQERESQLIDALYSIVPRDKDSLESVPFIMEFKPTFVYYMIKSLAVNRLDRGQYDKIKSVEAFREDILQSQSLSAVYFSPKNIIKRTNYKSATPQEETEDDTKKDSKDSS